MKTKQLLIIPALLVAVLCMATTCKETKPAMVRCWINVTNNTDKTINLKALNQESDINVEIQASEKEKAIEFWLLNQSNDQIVKLTFANASSGVFADTTLTLKQPLPEKISATVNKDLTLTLTVVKK